MSQNLNQAVALLTDLLELSRVTTSAVDQPRLDAAVDALADIALQDVERFTTQLAMEAQAAIDLAVEQDAKTAQAAIDDADRADREVEQEEIDQEQREERQRAGIS